jgi:hypothetical protein
VSIVSGSCIGDRRWVGAQKGPGALFLGIFLAFTLVHTLGTAAFGAQSREECNKCCQAQNADDYYAEQCRLKCFRNSNYCMEQKSSRKHQPPPAAAAEAPQRQPTPSAEAPKQRPKRTTFRLPNPLNLTPGRESDAAAQILALNGILPQHPRYQAALQAMTNVLVNFARAHPSGGKLPVAQLENILRQMR